MHPSCVPSIANDIHSRLNATRVAAIHQPGSVSGIRACILDAARQDLPLAMCGGRHAMGGQQFALDGVPLDMDQMRRVLAFDDAAGLIEVEAGIQWPELIDYLARAPAPHGRRWSIRQKQTGADRLSLGGCLAANIHGRGLRMRPFIDDVESFTLVDAHGELRRCSRTGDPDVRACYPDVNEFFAAKRRYDPQQRFQSDWYRHYSPLPT